MTAEAVKVSNFTTHLFWIPKDQEVWPSLFEECVTLAGQGECLTPPTSAPEDGPPKRALIQCRQWERLQTPLYSTKRIKSLREFAYTEF